MRRLILLIICGLALAGCWRGPSGTWRASHPRGDDPALAMELTRDGSKFSGTMHLLNPNAPTDFSYGPVFPMKIESANNQEIHYSVEFLPHQPDELVLRFDQPPEGVKFHAVMTLANGAGDPIDFDFERVTTP
ncbi:MAG TPA: hypothetical protein VHC95_07730 [Opitutales bacterium]|nr:hypothetical protein [Opitutales bacterium]